MTEDDKRIDEMWPKAANGFVKRHEGKHLLSLRIACPTDRRTPIHFIASHLCSNTSGTGTPCNSQNALLMDGHGKSNEESFHFEARLVRDDRILEKVSARCSHKAFVGMVQ
uniref:Uncharacterized protein n=1 Tax=Vespula pensylvanica TaxID=30213 RepID=A0A834UC55_VESPE|nr:hypothetical protein H0235_006027 [Vespula pensylvanica]